MRLRDKEESVQSFLQTDIRGVVRRCCVTLIFEGRLGTACAITKHVRFEIGKLLFDIIVRCALREAGLGAQV